MAAEQILSGHITQLETSVSNNLTITNRVELFTNLYINI